MTAVRWECAWQFNVVLVFLLAWHSNALNISTDQPYTPYKSSDFVDVTQQRRETGQSETGLTSRFYTSGDVDETFWLKNLGEDFKNAIHLQVGGEERYNGVFNMSENGSAYKVQQDTTNNPVQENEEKLTKVHDKPVEEKIENKVKTVDVNKKMRKLRRKHRNKPKLEDDEETDDQPKTITSTEKQQTTEDTISAQFIGSNDRSFNEVPKQSDYKDDVKKYKGLKYVPEYNGTDTKENNTEKDTNTRILDRTVEETPVVVNLPDTNKQIELETNDAPAVVKTPPVIYHSQPTNVRDPNNYTDNTETNTQTRTTQAQGEEQALDAEQTQTHTPDEQEIDGEKTQTQTDNTQYIQHTYQPVMTYDQQQEHTKYSSILNQYFQQTSQKQQIPYPIQMTVPQYTTQFHHPTLYDQQPQLMQQSHQQYASSSPYASTNYYNQGVNINTIPLQQPYALQSNSIMKSDYMPVKRTVSSYDEYDVSQAPADCIYQEYSRDSRSNGELYQQGL